jgi:hypothetical protein
MGFSRQEEGDQEVDMVLFVDDAFVKPSEQEKLTTTMEES